MTRVYPSAPNILLDLAVYVSIMVTLVGNLFQLQCAHIPSLIDHLHKGLSAYTWDLEYELLYDSVYDFLHRVVRN
jgi:hypothetical protein